MTGAAGFGAGGGVSTTGAGTGAGEGTEGAGIRGVDVVVVGSSIDFTGVDVGSASFFSSSLTGTGTASSRFSSTFSSNFFSSTTTDSFFVASSSTFVSLTGSSSSFFFLIVSFSLSFPLSITSGGNLGKCPYPGGTLTPLPNVTASNLFGSGSLDFLCFLLTGVAS